MEMPLGAPYGKVKFTLVRGTPHIHTVWLFVTIVDTTAYDAYTEQFKYRWTGDDGEAQVHMISAPRHVATPLLIAYAFFGGLISGEADLQDV